MNAYGISEQSYKWILDAISQCPVIEEVYLFGSRAKGTYKKGSDIDLAVKGRDCTSAIALDLQTLLNEKLPIPYMVDVVDYGSLTHQELREHIQRVGVVIYRKSG